MKVWTLNISLWYVFRWVLHEQLVKSDSPNCTCISFHWDYKDYKDTSPILMACTGLKKLLIESFGPRSLQFHDYIDQSL